MGKHVELNLGNILFIGGIAAGTMLASMALLHFFSRRDVPVVSPAARGTVDFIGKVAA